VITSHGDIQALVIRVSSPEMTRPDSMPLKYHKDDKEGKYKPVVDEKMGQKKHWNLRHLSKRTRRNTVKFVHKE
jgi:hypothetical protein